jgi:hypothetical protein
MSRRSALITLFAVLILAAAAAAQPAFASQASQASQVKPSPAGALIQGLELWLASWAPWVGGGGAASTRGIGASAEPGTAAVDRAGQEPGEFYRPIAGQARLNRAGRDGTAERQSNTKCSGATDPNGVCH